MNLPKLYRKVWIEWEWITDHCWDGEHTQNSGFEYFQAYRTKSGDNTWYWKLVDESKKPNAWESYEDGEFICEYIVSKPTQYNYFYPFNVPSIKKQEEQELERKRPFKPLF